LHLTRQQIHVGSLFLFRTDLGERTNENERERREQRKRTSCQCCTQEYGECAEV
jgi:hypothetical protein